MDISHGKAVYPLRLLWRAIIVLCLLFLVNGFLKTEDPQAYISNPQINVLFEKIEWRAEQIKEAAQDLPGNIEVMLRQIFSDGIPKTEAKSV